MRKNRRRRIFKNSFNMNRLLKIIQIYIKLKLIKFLNL